MAKGAANTREAPHGPGSVLHTAGRRWPEEGTALTCPASAAAEQWLRGRLAGPGTGSPLAQAGLTRGNYKLLCRLLELKVTGQPRVTRVWNSKMRPSVHWAT